MSILCGVDIIEIDRIRKSLETIGTSFRDKVFTKNEIEYCESKRAAKYQSYAARFAAKEAVSKAFGTGISGGLGWKSIEVLNEEAGKPYIMLHDTAKDMFREIQGKSISLSISHSENYAIAYVAMETC